jgi:hypothetical protein
MWQFGNLSIHFWNHGACAFKCYNQVACTGANGRNQAATWFESWFLDFVVAFKGNVGQWVQHKLLIHTLDYLQSDSRGVCNWMPTQTAPAAPRAELLSQCALCKSFRTQWLLHFGNQTVVIWIEVRRFGSGGGVVTLLTPAAREYSWRLQLYRVGWSYFHPVLGASP